METARAGKQSARGYPRDFLCRIPSVQHHPRASTLPFQFTDREWSSGARGEARHRYTVWARMAPHMVSTLTT